MLIADLITPKAYISLKLQCKKYINVIIESLSPFQKHSFRDGDGYTVACPFCRNAQKNDSKCRERCAAIYTVEGTYSDFFSCNRGLNEGKGNQQHSSTMRFSTLLRRWNPPLFRKYVREKEMAKRNSRTKFADKG